MRTAIKTLSRNWLKIFWLFAFFIPVGNMHSAAEPPTKFIIVADRDPSYGLESFIKKYGDILSQQLGLSPQSKTEVFPEHQILDEKFFQQIPDPIAQSCVIIAQGKRAEEIIKVFEQGSEPPKTVHSMILFDPKISGITHIDYDRIINRIYNFYSEYSSAQYRKINSHYDLLKNQLQGLNIKCEYINDLGARLPVNFIDLFSTGDKLEQHLGYLSDTIVAIKELKTYKVENDFHCVLFSLNNTVLPEKSCPIININKRAFIENNILLTHIRTGVSRDYNNPASDQLSPELFKKIEEQRIIELKKSDNIVAQYPAFTERLSLTERLVTPEFWKNWNGVNNEYKKKLEASSPRGPEKARARIGLNSECPEEQNYLRNRSPKVHACLTKHNIIKANEQSPIIAVVASGGGVRAMVATLGALQGLQASDLMDAVTYLCGLSGSTWAIGPWISSGMNIDEFALLMTHQLIKGIMTNPGDLAPVMIGDPRFPRIFATITSPYSYKKITGLPYTMIDIYAGYLQDYLLPENLKFSYLSQQAVRINKGTVPLPIYTAIRADGKTEVVDKEVVEQGLGLWYQFTPYEIGATWLDRKQKGIYIPSWAFGRSFFNGESINTMFEQPLASYMAIFGSAFALSVGKAIAEVLGNKPGLAQLGLIIPLIVDERRQIIAARYNNFTSGMPESEIDGRPYMQMADAGLAFNLPYPPISGEQDSRKADVIIFVDASDDASNPGSELRLVAKYARNKQLKFPDLDNQEINIGTMQAELKEASFEDSINQPVRIFMSYEPQCPLVIYVRFNAGEPVIQNCMQSVCGTFNFVYPQKIVDDLLSMMKSKITDNANAIMRSINMHQLLQTDAHLQDDLRSHQQLRIMGKKEEWPPKIRE